MGLTRARINKSVPNKIRDWIDDLRSTKKIIKELENEKPNFNKIRRWCGKKEKQARKLGKHVKKLRKEYKRNQEKNSKTLEVLYNFKETMNVAKHIEKNYKEVSDAIDERKNEHVIKEVRYLN